MKLRSILRDWRVIVGCAFALALLGVSVAPVADPQTNPTGFALLQLGLMAPVLLAVGKYLVAGVRGPGVDRLLALGVLAAVIYSVINLVWVAAGYAAAAGQVYLAVAGVTVALYLLGRFLEERGVRRVAKLNEQLAGPYIEQQNEGERVTVRPGERVPADGLILDGQSALDEGQITGVGMPVDKGPGDTVLAGSVNTVAELIIETGEAAQIVGAVCIRPQIEAGQTADAEPAENTDQNRARQPGGWFVYVFAVLAVVAGAAYFVAGGWDVYLGVSVLFWVLMSACPVAVYLAGPIAAMAGANKGAGLSIVVKNPGALESAHKVDVVVIDKTGTITSGKPVLSDILPQKGVEKSELLLLAASAAGVSNHPVMRALTARAKQERMVPLHVDRFRELPGKGLRVNIGEQVYHLGDAGLMDLCGIPVQGMLSFEGYRLQAEGKTTLYLARDGKLMGIIAVADLPKNSSAPAIKELIAAGLDVVMVTGDARWPAGKIAGAVGITQLVARACADEKVSQVRRFQAMGKRVVMVGDGISDAPALAAADVGIATGQNAALQAKLAADIIIEADDLSALPGTIELSRVTAKVAMQNIFIGLGYGLVCAAIAAGAIYPVSGGFMLPGVLLAAVFLAAGTVMVNSIRLMTIDN